MVHHDFFVKSCGFLTAFQINGIFQNLEKVRKKFEKKFEKKLKIKNRENQFVFEQNVDEVYARARAHLE